MRRIVQSPHLAAFLFYTGIAMLITWPLVTVLSTRLVGFPYSDAYEMARHIWWFKHALQTGQPLFFQPMLGFPDGIDGVSLWADPLQFFPAWLFAFVLPLPAAYNVTILLTLALNGWTMYWLALHLYARHEQSPTSKGLKPLVQTRGAALLAGLVFMAFPTMQGHLGAGHAGLLVMWPVPLYVYSLTRLRETGERRWLALSVLWFVLSPGGHALQLIYVVLPVTVWFVLRQVAEHDWRGLRRTVLVAVLGGVGLLVFLVPVILATLQTPTYGAEGGSVRYSADLLGIVTPSFFHPVFGQWEYTHRVLGINIDEGAAYVGVVAGLLALLAVRTGPASPDEGSKAALSRWRRREARWWAVLALVAWVLALGPLLKVLDTPVQVQVGEYSTHVTLPWALVEELPLFNLARTPARFNFTLALALAVMTGYGVMTLLREGVVGTRCIVPVRFLPLRNVRLSWIVLGVMMAVVLWEYQVFWPVPTVDAAIPEAVRALAGRGDIRAVFDLPWENLLVAKDALYLQTAHEHALIAGQVTRRTPVDPAKLTLLEQTLDPALLDAAGADVVIVHKEYVDEVVLAFAGAQLGSPVYEDERIAIFETPDAGDVPGFQMVATSAEEIGSQAESYLYAPETGWIALAGQVASDGRELVLYLDNQRLHQWTVEDELELNLALPLASTGYHTVRLAVEPPCPEHYEAALECRSMLLNDLRLGDFVPDALNGTVQFERGLQLAGARLPEEVRAGETLAVDLWWRFEEGRTDQEVRFIHVLNAAGEAVVQADGTLGMQPEGGQWVERVLLELPENVVEGTYQVYAGWYTYPDLRRFEVLSEAEGAENGLALVGEVEVSD